MIRGFMTDSSKRSEHLDIGMPLTIVNHRSESVHQFTKQILVEFIGSRAIKMAEYIREDRS